jgi:hypothetical protein
MNLYQVLITDDAKALKQLAVMGKFMPMHSLTGK